MIWGSPQVLQHLPEFCCPGKGNLSVSRASMKKVSDTPIYALFGSPHSWYLLASRGHLATHLLLGSLYSTCNGVGPGVPSNSLQQATSPI